jgi:hypothetical protein
VNFPNSTKVGRILPKEAFYERLNLTKELKDKFVSDIKRITLEHSLTSQTMNLPDTSEVKEIIVLAIDLKHKDLDYRVVESIAKQNKHKIVFLLRFEELGQCVVHYNKLYKGEWESLNQVHIELRGFSLDEVWSNLVEKIAVKIQTNLPDLDTDINKKLKFQETILKLQKEIEKTERLARSEKQPKKKFDLAMKVQKMQCELDDIFKNLN